MKLENKSLILDSQISSEEINDLISKLVLEIENIDKVEIENLNNGIANSALFALLQAIKKRKEDIEIPFLKTYQEVSNMGKVLFVK